MFWFQFVLLTFGCTNVFWFWLTIRSIELWRNKNRSHKSEEYGEAETFRTYERYRMRRVALLVKAFNRRMWESIIIQHTRGSSLVGIFILFLTIMVWPL